MFHRAVLILAVAGVLLPAGLAYALPLDMPYHLPDIFSGGISVSYTAATDAFTASGLPFQYALPPTFPIIPGLFSLTAVIDSSGVLSSGVLSISGATSGGSGSGGSELLLSASFADFGFVPDGGSGAPTFEFLGLVTGGSLAPDYHGIGAAVGVTLSAFDTFTGNFASDYAATNAVADTFSAIPEPTTLSLLALGAIGIGVRRRRRRRECQEPRLRRNSAVNL